MGRFEPCGDCVFIDHEAVFSEFLNDRVCYRGIDDLVSPKELYPVFLPSPSVLPRPHFEVLVFQVFRPDRPVLPITSHFYEASVLGLANVGDDLHCLPLLRRSHQRHALFHDACFLPRDQGDGVAQQLRVIVAQRGNCAHDGVHNVGSVQPPAKPHFQDCYIDPLIGKELEREPGDQLERGEPGDCPCRRFYAFHQIRELELADKIAIHSDPFPEGMQVRGGEQPRFVACVP